MGARGHTGYLLFARKMVQLCDIPGAEAKSVVVETPAVEAVAAGGEGDGAADMAVDAQ